MKDVSRNIIIVLFVILQYNIQIKQSKAGQTKANLNIENVGHVVGDKTTKIKIDDIEYKPPKTTKKDQYKKKIEKINKEKEEKEKQKNNEYFVIGSEFGTDGFGFSIGYNYKSFGFKIFLSTLKLKNIHINNNSLTLKLENYGFNFLIYPFRWLHFDIGLHYMNNILYIVANRDVNLLGTNINVDANIDINLGHSFRPYLGIGFDIRLFAGLFLTIDLGIFITGDWSIKKFTIDAKQWDTTFIFENTYEEVKFVTGASLPKLSFWPIIRVGLSYKFYI